MELIRKAKEKAIAWHDSTGCTYHGESFEGHLTQVQANVIMLLNNTGNYYSLEVQANLIAAAWLHDVIEDCRVNYNELVEEFNLEVAEIVYAVTNELGKNRKERAIRTYPKIAANPLATIVKLADRIANTSFSKSIESSMFKKYAQEYPYFKEVIGAVQYPEDHPITKGWTILEELYSV